MAGVSTASLGRFDKQIRGEAPRKLPGKKRKFAPNLDPSGAADDAAKKLADKVVRERSSDIVDIQRAMGKLEAARREARHEEKVRAGEAG